MPGKQRRELSALGTVLDFDPLLSHLAFASQRLDLILLLAFKVIQIVKRAISLTNHSGQLQVLALHLLLKLLPLFDCSFGGGRLEMLLFELSE